ncbi:hypothetical protein SISNIDRAFT_451605 [Sistotremastrum niveocremeum HHB9708]|uniref:Integral membrane protein n=2 Tax=Sistotremastraceae TaxID=3402574 RepID=A0A164XGC9_9AGAM|nr:hypothetical protein SISNIDRAFT_451605 [Sistotremastrum niveocremeum HHB9708]KZT41326.1 hypothetical protein SISSUDRAFT_1042906 [Sistotremastrum suecicum HHB10207 ss-3]
MSTVSKNTSPRLLAAYLNQLNKHPLRTKMITGGVLSFLQEILAGQLAGAPTPPLSKIHPIVAHVLSQAGVDAKAIKMAIYGFLISAPMGHVLVGLLQKAFAGRTSARAKLAQLLANNIFIAPIQTTVFLASMAVINGVRDPNTILNIIKSRFLSVIKITWVASPLTIASAQRFLAPELWVPYFNLVAFTIGTYVNMKIKKHTMAVERKAQKAREAKDVKPRED